MIQEEEASESNASITNCNQAYQSLPLWNVTEEVTVCQVRVEEHTVRAYYALGCQGRFSRQAFYKTEIPEGKIPSSTHSFQFSFKKIEKEKATLSADIIYRKQPELK